MKLVAGTERADRRNGSEPEPDFVDDVTPPLHLSDRSAVVWRELAPMLKSIKVLTVADLLALELLCDAVSDYRHARTELGLNFVKSTQHGQMLSQWMVAKSMSRKAAEGLMSKFGMDPVSRSRVMVDPQGDMFGKQPPTTGPERHFN